METRGETRVGGSRARVVAGVEGLECVVDEFGNGKPDVRVDLEGILPHPDRYAGLRFDCHVAPLHAAVRPHHDHNVQTLEVSVRPVRS